MSNGYFNNQSGVKPVLVKGKGADPAPLKGGMSAPMKEKSWCNAGLPGKAQSGDRSGGVKKIKQYPDSKGL